MSKSATATQYVFTVVSTLIGSLTLVAGERGLTAIQWATETSNQQRLRGAREDPKHPVLIKTQRQLAEYFAGNRKRFDLTLDPAGTEFQKRVWAELLKIPFGETRAYGQIAKQIGDAKAVRAVGAANGANPIPIVVPCHRVIGATGTLVGFGGGLATKALLLDLERGVIAFAFTNASSPR